MEAWENITLVEIQNTGEDGKYENEDRAENTVHDVTKNRNPYTVRSGEVKDQTE